MKQVCQRKYLPHAPADIYDLIMDVGSYPALFPMVRSAQMTRTPGGGLEVALAFNLPPAVSVKDPVHVARVTGVKPDWIAAQRVKGPLKAMDLRWELAPAGNGGTDLAFRMDYELGFGFFVNALLQAHIDDLLKKAMTRFAAHAAQTLGPGAKPVAANQNLMPAKARGQKAGPGSP